MKSGSTIKTYTRYAVREQNSLEIVCERERGREEVREEACPLSSPRPLLGLPPQVHEMRINLQLNPHFPVTEGVFHALLHDLHRLVLRHGRTF